ncbi:histidine phosphatase family protein [Sphingomonas psychrotolerans]|uniref:Histidine phosphatase family protein n=1 Tax=Sphingomonas psychrotolerans TaxID=1327635 RepID=A0ABU3MZN3_9SPHN|nr:histidine phosphatase family protein [Sphingomonas psychrotolerans]MDT8757687.1 histidine phosphatase family protein [Sphingomonas psychrotolerans]
MTVTIHLVRHGTHAEVGRVLSGRSEIALDTRGCGEVQALVDVVSGLPIRSLHTSPRRRARETIAPLAARLGLDVHITPALDEVDFGGFTGRSFAELDGDPAWQKWNAERNEARCPGGETMAEAAVRAAAYLRGIPSDQSPALCVSHCDVIRGVVAQALGLSFDRIFQFDCDPASITTLELSGAGARIVSLNQRARR